MRGGTKTGAVICLLLSLSLTGRPALGGGLWDSCARGLESLGLVFTTAHWRGTDDIRLSEDQLAQLAQWNARVSPRFPGSYGAPRVLEAHALYLLGELPEEIRREMFTRGGKTLTANQARNRMIALGIDTFQNASLTVLLNDYGNSITYPKARDAYQVLEERIRRVQTLSKEELADLRAEVQRRWEIEEIQSRLGNSRNPEYEIKIEGDALIVPDGKRYPIVKRFSDGRISFDVRVENVMGTQDRFFLEHYARHMVEKTGEGVGFEGMLVADGRVMLPLDGHHRTAAYADRHDGWVRFWIRPAEDGRYYAQPHFTVLTFYAPQYGFSYWYGLSESERAEALDQVRRSPLKVGRELYDSGLRKRPLR